MFVSGLGKSRQAPRLKQTALKGEGTQQLVLQRFGSYLADRTIIGLPA
jgi:hypothetical protein